MANSKSAPAAQSRPLLRMLARALWATILYAAIIAAALRIIFGQSSTNPAIGFGLKILVFVLGYALFLLEGLLVAATQIRASDADGVAAWITRHVPASEKAKATQLAEIFQTRFEDFVSGRQLFVMLIVVALAFSIDHLPIDNDSNLSNIISTIGLIGYNLNGVLISKTIGGFYATFALVTLLPCWTSQLLPQVLADERSFEFIRFYLSGNAVRISLLISRLGAGWPGRHFVWFFNRAGKFTHTETFEVGDRSVFEKAAAAAGNHIDQRSVSIVASREGCRVNDTSHYVFSSGETSSIQHTIRVGPKTATLHGWTVDPPTGLRMSEPEVRALSVTTHAIEGAQPRKLEDTLIFATSVSLGVPLPNSVTGANGISFAAEYSIEALNLEPNCQNELYVDVPRLTRVMAVTLLSESSILLLKPRVEFIGLGDGKFLANPTPMPPPAIEIEARELGWEVVAKFPPQNSVCVIRLEAKPTATNGGA